MLARKVFRFWLLFDIRLITELTNPAPCAFAVGTEKMDSTVNSNPTAKPKENIFFIIAPKTEGPCGPHDLPRVRWKTSRAPGRFMLENYKAWSANVNLIAD